MPAKTLPPDFFSKYGSQVCETFKENASTPANPGIIRLPGGINNGIAQLYECYFGEGDKGGYWRAAGKVVAPDHVGNNGSMVPLRGLVTSVVVMIKPDDVGKAFAEIMNELKLLAGDKVFVTTPKEIYSDIAKLGPYLHTLSEKLAGKNPYFRFSTELGKVTPQYPTPRVWERWHGSMGLEGYAPSGNGMAPVAATVPGFDTPNPAVTAAAKAPVKTKPTPVVAPVGDDPLVLLDKTKTGDDTARTRLVELSKKKGHSEEDFDNASWEEIEGWFASDDTTSGSSKTTHTPTVGEVVDYAPVDPKNAKKRLKVTEYEVTELDTDDETMSLRSLKDSKRTAKGVKWNDENVTYNT